MKVRNLARRVKRRFFAPHEGRQPVPASQNSYLEPGNQWYHPVLAGPQTLAADTMAVQTLKDVLAVMDRLSPDLYVDFMRRYYRAGLARFGDAWRFADISTVLLSLSRRLQPATYLEIGVRRGRSMAMVASGSPNCDLYGFDMWIANYAGMENPGEGLVREELIAIGHKGQVNLVTGDSHETVPRFLAENPYLYFDLITVDGDHSIEGARADLLTVMPRLTAGGALVFDDTSNQSHPGLSQLWEDTVANHPGFSTWSFNDAGFGVAFAIRKG